MLLVMYYIQLTKKFLLLSSTAMVHFTDNLHSSSWKVPTPAICMNVAGLAYTKQPLSWILN